MTNFRFYFLFFAVLDFSYSNLANLENFLIIDKLFSRLENHFGELARSVQINFSLKRFQ